VLFSAHTGDSAWNNFTLIRNKFSEQRNIFIVNRPLTEDLFSFVENGHWSLKGSLSTTTGCKFHRRMDSMLKKRAQKEAGKSISPVSGL